MVLFRLPGVIFEFIVFSINIRMCDNNIIHPLFEASSDLRQESKPHTKAALQKACNSFAIILQDAIGKNDLVLIPYWSVVYS